MESIVPIWMEIDIESKDKEKVLSAMETLDARTLAEVAEQAPYTFVRRHAVSLLTDQALLAGLAREATLALVRRDAIIKLKDQTLIAEIVQAEDEVSVICDAVSMLTDQTILASWQRRRTNISCAGLPQKN